MAAMGTRLLGGRYALLEVLGTGGMATVWLARDEVLGRDVAVKVLSPQLAADASFAARFGREARHAAALSHPRLVTVFDSGTDGRTAFIVMELVAGRTLRQVLDEAGVLPPGDAVAIAAAVCEGLAAAHAAGLVHRDIKSANIALARDGVKVLDFGIARADGPDAGTKTLGVIGTAAYLSPEQAAGQVAGPRSDLYSLGCVLFEMLTGAPPFSADSAVGLAYRQVHDDPGLPSARRPGLPPRLDQVTARLLAKDPAGRPSSAAAARAELLAAHDPGATTVFRGPGEDPGGPGRPGTRRHASRTEIALAAALAAALTALAVVLASGPGSHAASAPPGTPASSGSPAPSRPATSPAARSHGKPHGKKKGHRAHGQASGLPPAAAAAARIVGDLEAGVADGQVTPQAGQDLYSHLQQLLFGPAGRSTQQLQQQFGQLVQAYDQRLAQGQLTGGAATALRGALAALGASLGAS